MSPDSDLSHLPPCLTFQALAAALKDYLISRPNLAESDFPSLGVCQLLLREDHADGNANADDGAIPVLGRLAEAPFYREVGRVVWLWLAVKQFPFTFKPLDGNSLVETGNWIIELNQRTDSLLSIASQWHDDAALCVERMLQLLGMEGVQTCLRVRRTAGTVAHALPLARLQLIESFNERHSQRPGVKLTVGARALSKHCIRSTEQWWGNANGPEDVKNRKALDVLARIIDDAAWVNIHMLPHDVCICEIRNSLGYGARWTTALGFRGFLEPQCEDGHEKGWLH